MKKSLPIDVRKFLQGLIDDMESPWFLDNNPNEAISFGLLANAEAARRFLDKYS